MAKSPGSSPVNNNQSYYRTVQHTGGISAFNGDSLMMRDSHLASSFFGFDGSYFNNVPKHDSLYFVKIVKGASTSSDPLNPDLLGGLTGAQSTQTNNDWSTNFGFLAREVIRPPVDIKTEVVNQYNKKRVIQTSIDYGQLDINFHDTVDNQIMNMFLEYFKFYFGDPHNNTSDAWMNDIVSGKFDTGADDWGFQLNGNSANNSYFFERIEIYHLFAGQYSRMDVVHPKISKMGPSRLSFESTKTAEIGITFNFEGMAFVESSAKVADNPGLISDLRLATASYYEPGKDVNFDELGWANSNDVALHQLDTTTKASDVLDSASISGFNLSGSAGNINSDKASELSGPPGVTGAYATEGSYTKLFNTIDQARVDTMASQGLGQTAANIGFDFFNTGELSNQYQRFSNPTLRNQSLLGKFI